MSSDEQEMTDDESFASDSEPDTNPDPQLESIYKSIRNIQVDNIIEQAEHIQQVLHDVHPIPSTEEYRKLIRSFTKRLNHLAKKVDGFVPFIDEQLKEILFDLEQLLPMDSILTTEDTTESSPSVGWIVPELDISAPEAIVDLEEKIPIPTLIQKEKPSSMPRLSEFKPESLANATGKKRKSKHARQRQSIQIKHLKQKQRPESVRKQKKKARLSSKNEGKKKKDIL